MKKQFLAIAIAAGLATPFMAQAEATVYGRAHISLDNIELGGGTQTGANAAACTAAGFTCADAELDFKDRKSAFGVKAKEDLGGGLTVMAKVEWSWDPADGGAIGTRDRWIGLKKAGMGTFKFGTMSSNYKQTAAKMDPFWHTAVEGRSTNSTSNLANSTGDDGGRMTNLLQFESAPMGGMQVVLNAQLNGTGEMTTGFGVRYDAKGLYVFADVLKFENDVTTPGNPPAPPADGLSDHRGYVAGESATKFGAKYTMDAITVGVTVEQTADVTASAKNAKDGFDYTTLMATYNVSDNDTVAFTYGMASADSAAGSANDMDVMAIGYMHNMSKRTTVYAAYGDGSSDTKANEFNGISLGIKHNF